MREGAGEDEAHAFSSIEGGFGKPEMDDCGRVETAWQYGHGATGCEFSTDQFH